MTRLNEQEAKKIIFNAQVASYPSNDVPLLLKPLYEYVESIEAENATLKRALELACDYLADNNASKVDWQKHFMEKAKEESENEAR